MLLSMAIPGTSETTTAPTFARSSFSRKLIVKPLSSSCSLNGFSVSNSVGLSGFFEKRKSPKWGIRAVAAEAAEAVEVAKNSVSATQESELESQPEEKEKLRVVVKLPGKPRLVLKFIWLEKNIGLALDQVIPGHGTIPLSPYYFWPRKDAWEELKSKLESKPWISQKRMIILLNQATDIINLWQQSGGNL